LKTVTELGDFFQQSVLRGTLKMMSESAQRAFDGWIKTETWHSGHPLDDQRFFRFVWAVVPQGKNRPSEEEIQQAITHTWQGRFAADYLAEKVRYYASLYVTLCDFADAHPQ